MASERKRPKQQKVSILGSFISRIKKRLERAAGRAGRVASHRHVTVFHPSGPPSRTSGIPWHGERVARSRRRAA
jgi:hypothetical protein